MCANPRFIIAKSFQSKRKEASKSLRTTLGESENVEVKTKSFNVLTLQRCFTQ